MIHAMVMYVVLGAVAREGGLSRVHCTSLQLTAVPGICYVGTMVGAHTDTQTSHHVRDKERLIGSESNKW